MAGSIPASVIMEINIPGIDAKKGLDLFEGDIDTYVVILRSYVTNVPADLDRIREVSRETLHKYAVAVHGIKGVSDAIGAEEARKTAKNLEGLAKGGDLAGVLAQNNAFIKYVENLIDDIRLWLQKHETA